MDSFLISVIIIDALILIALYGVALYTIKSIYSDIGGKNSLKTSFTYLSVTSNNCGKVLVYSDSKMIKKVSSDFKGIVRLPTGMHKVSFCQDDIELLFDDEIKNGLDISLDFNKGSLTRNYSNLNYTSNNDRSSKMWVVVIIVFVLLATVALVSRTIEVINNW